MTLNCCEIELVFDFTLYNIRWSRAFSPLNFPSVLWTVGSREQMDSNSTRYSAHASYNVVVNAGLNWKKWKPSSVNNSSRVFHGLQTMSTYFFFEWNIILSKKCYERAVKRFLADKALGDKEPGTKDSNIYCNIKENH